MAVTLIVKINVQDFTTWKAAFDAAEGFRRSLGIVITGIYPSVDDNKCIHLLSEYPSLEMARGVLANPEWEANQRKAGVIGGFEVTICNSVLQ